ncbi:hypothetical protein Taro_033271, partial [Colocasia esculenta]|nr:hypothetical protein [Colocasia esculenta]
GQTREQPFPLLFLLFFSFSIFVRFHSFRWLTGARGKTLVREAELDRAENSGSGGGFHEEASKGSTRIEVWQDFLHASECSVLWGRVSPSSFRWSEGWIALFGIDVCLFSAAGNWRAKRQGLLTLNSSGKKLTVGALAVNLFSGGSRRRVLDVYFTLDVKLCYRLHPG